MTKEERNSIIDEALVVVKASFDHNLAMVKLYSPPFVEADHHCRTPESWPAVEKGAPIAYCHGVT